MRTITACSLVLFLIIGGCANNPDETISKNGHQIRKEFFSNGNLASQCSYINDTIKDGACLRFYETGELKEELNYKNGKKNGLQKEYFENGRIAMLYSFKDGVQEGNVISYYESGHIEYEGSFKSGEPYGDAKFYYSNGKLKNYNCIDFFGGVVYVIKWDSLGNKVKEEGIPFSPKISSEDGYSGDSIPAGEEVEFSITVAQPPNTNTLIKIGELNEKGEIENLIEYPIKESTVVYRNTFTRKGKHTLVIVGEIKDSEGRIISQNTIQTNLIVL